MRIQTSDNFRKIRKRKKIKFLLLPRKLQGEWRWLEFVTVEQIRVVEYKFVPPCIGPSGNYHFWKNIRWLN